MSHGLPWSLRSLSMLLEDAVSPVLSSSLSYRVLRFIRAGFPSIDDDSRISLEVGLPRREFSFKLARILVELGVNG